VTLDFIPFVKAYRDGKSGPTSGVFFSTRFSYTHVAPGIIFGLAGSVWVFKFPAEIAAVIASLREEFSIAAAFILMIYVIYLVVAYEFLMRFSYWLGVQAGLRSRK